MKKTFVEPEMKVILVNLNENIAASTTEKTTSFGVVLILNDQNKVINTGLSYDTVSGYITNIFNTGNIHGDKNSPSTYSLRDDLITSANSQISGFTGCGY